MATVPPSTPEQRAEALRTAIEVRRARSRLLRDVKDGALSPAAVFELASNGDAVAKGTRVFQLLTALPGIGQVKATAAMHYAGIEETRRVGGVGDQQRRALLERLRR